MMVENNIPIGPICCAARTGENTKAESVAGMKVFFKNEVSPKMNPRKAPLFGPR